MLADTGAEWASYFGMYDSGTYNNQWQILDFNKFHIGQMPEKGFFHVFESMPGYAMYRDLTTLLIENGYWASYNIPYFEEIYRIAGYDKMNNATAWDTYNYKKNPRAKMFQQRAKRANTVEEVMKLLQYNKWQKDPLGEYHPSQFIAARGDLEDTASSFHWIGGSIDCKVATYTSTQMVRENDVHSTGPIVYGRVGPTTDNQDPFCWNNKIKDKNNHGSNSTSIPALYKHEGHP